MTVVTWTTFTFLTSPVSGVIFGGFLNDKIGGSKGKKQMKKAIRLSTLFAFLASALAVVCTMVTYMIAFGLSLWLVLFFGGALVPTATTLLIHSVPGSLRSHASALTQFSQNLLGYFPAPLISGAVMDAVSHAGATGTVPLMWGFRFVMYSSVIGFIFCACANCVDTMEFEEEVASPDKRRKPRDGRVAAAAGDASIPLRTPPRAGRRASPHSSSPRRQRSESHRKGTPPSPSLARFPVGAPNGPPAFISSSLLSGAGRRGSD
eukprot:Selendium_serpulae@DN11193_c0_g1_i1.p1